MNEEKPSLNPQLIPQPPVSNLVPTNSIDPNNPPNSGSMNRSNRPRVNRDAFNAEFPKAPVTLTCLQTWNYTPLDGSFPPVAVDYRFVRPVKNPEQAYLRTFNLGEEWVAIDTGWLQLNVGTFIIQNERKKFDKNPTPQEKELVEAAVVEFGLGYVVEAERKPDPADKGRDMFSPPKPPGTEADTVQVKLEVIPLFLIPVGEAHSFNTINPNMFYVRCQKGKARLNVTAFPK